MTDVEVLLEFMADPEVKDALRTWAVQQMLWKGEHKPWNSGSPELLRKLEQLLERAQFRRVEIARQAALFVHTRD